MLLSIAYFPPISYFVMMAKGMKFTADGIIPSAVTLEACETYRKQTWRNRCRICSASGPEYLNFPIVHENGHELPIREIKVDYSTPWVVRTQRTISSAYDSSAYFAYYKDELFSILESRPETLFELDLEIIRFFLRKTGVAADISFTTSYRFPQEAVPEDYREAIHPKKPDLILEQEGLLKPYFQVFAGKYGFIANLSIMDLLFNEGPESILYLRKA